MGRITVAEQCPAHKCSYKGAFSGSSSLGAPLWEQFAEESELSPSRAQTLEGLELLLCSTSNVTVKGKKGCRRETLNIPGMILLRACHKPWECYCGTLFAVSVSVCKWTPRCLVNRNRPCNPGSLSSFHSHTPVV